MEREGGVAERQTETDRQKEKQREREDGHRQRE